MPIIKTTTNNSSKVKPFLFFINSPKLPYTAFLFSDRYIYEKKKKMQIRVDFALLTGICNNFSYIKRGKYFKIVSTLKSIIFLLCRVKSSPSRTTI